MTYLQAQNLSISYATKFGPASGNCRLRIALNPSDKKTNIVARNSFVTLINLIETLLYKCCNRKKTWAKIYIQNGVKITSLLVNIKSLCNRTLLNRDEILSKSPEELSHLLADPKTSAWTYKKLNDFFPNVTLINLDRAQDRITSLQEHLSTIGEKDFKYTRFSAVDAKKLAPREPNEQYVDTCRHACYLSHLNAIKQAKAQNLPHVLILEDDVRFAAQDMQGPHMQKMMQELPKNWGLLFLGYTEDAPRLAKNYSEYLKQPGIPFAMHAYVVNASMYDTLITTFEAWLANPEKLPPVDLVMAYQIAKKFMDQKIVFAANTNIAFQDEGFSNICNINYAPFKKESDAYYKRYDVKNPNRTITADGLPIMNPKIAGALYQMTHHATTIFNKHNIRYWADGGTILGIARHGGLIPHDNNVNLCIFPDDIEKLKNPQVTADFANVGLEIVDHCAGAKICAIQAHPNGQSHSLNGYQYRSPNIDLFFTKTSTINGEKAYTYSTPWATNLWPDYHHKHSQVFNTQNIIQKGTFGPIQLNTVLDPVKYCKQYYGENCMHEAYVQYDHIHERSLTQKPIQLTDYRLGSYKEWDKLPPLPKTP